MPFYTLHVLQNFHTFGCDFFSIAESLLPIVSWIFQTFIEIEFQNSITSWLLYHEHATHATNKWENLTKKYRIYAACSNFSFIQLSKTRPRERRCRREC